MDDASTDVPLQCRLAVANFVITTVREIVSDVYGSKSTPVRGDSLCSACNENNDFQTSERLHLLRIAIATLKQCRAIADAILLLYHKLKKSQTKIDFEVSEALPHLRLIDSLLLKVWKKQAEVVKDYNHVISKSNEHSLESAERGERYHLSQACLLLSAEDQSDCIKPRSISALDILSFQERERKILLEEELHSAHLLLKHLWHNVERGTDPLDVSYSKLANVIRALRSQEASIDFHASLLYSQLEILEGCHLDQDSLAFGSTPFSSWIALWLDWANLNNSTQSGSTSYSLSHWLEHCVTHNLNKHVVFGSSSGSLVLYSAITFGPRIVCEGYEIIPHLVAVAKQISDAAGIQNASFMLQDMLMSSLEGAGLVILTSQCWERALYEQVLAKLARELPLGAVVIDYLPALAEHGQHFEEICQTVVSVSWNQKQSLHIFHRRNE